MNLLNFKIAKRFTRIILFIFAFFVQVSVKAWTIDMSRRQKDLTSLKMPAQIVDKKQNSEESILSSYFQASEPTQDIVIMNTDSGFVPQTLHLKKGMNYKIHIVNVNGKEKNTSFVLDAFSEHHATFFGERKTFQISPKTDGIFSFQCPETAYQGKIIVFSDETGSHRKPASK